MENGAQLGWLMDPQEKRVYIYRPSVAVECLDEPDILKGEPPLSGLRLPVLKLWE